MENNYTKMILQGGNILVKELQDDLVINGVVSRYDSDNPYMFCEILNISEESRTEMKLEKDIKDVVLVIKRYAKEEYIGDSYFISYKDVRAIIDKEDYDSLVA